MQSALERWQELIDARTQQMDAAYARLGRTSADFWDRRAHIFHRVTKNTVTSDPLYHKVSQEVTAQTSILDVGAGTGRFALALAPQVKQVVAVEPNATMLGYLQAEADAQRITNISSIPTTWQQAPDNLQADIVLCSHVLYPLRDVDVFLTKLMAATRQSCYITMRATHFDALTGHLWEHFHGEPRRLPPGYIHALDVLYEMGIYADVEVTKQPSSMRFLTLDEATEQMVEQLILPGDEQTRAQLRLVLDDWLVERDGMLTFPHDEIVSALLFWHC
jgi:SAM-dependent methyltransferase